MKSIQLYNKKLITQLIKIWYNINIFILNNFRIKIKLFIIVFYIIVYLNKLDIILDKILNFELIFPIKI